MAKSRQTRDGRSYILALDQGTSGSAAILFDGQGQVVASADRELTQHYPRPGWVEHDPEEIFQVTLAVAREALEAARVPPSRVRAIGVTNQRETTVLWERATGRPVANAVVWQCRRTADQCQELRRRGLETAVREKTGLVIDPYFSATKLRWLLDQLPDGQRRAQEGDLCFGTVDSWLLYLSGGRVHATDCTNASRTMLFNIHTLAWDEELLSALDIPRAVLPQVRPSSGFFGEANPELLGASIPITGVAGDQHAALFGQACFEPGMVKNTYGTGCFLLMYTGQHPTPSRHGLLSTVAWSMGEGAGEYALEGSVFTAGAALQWLRDGLGILRGAWETEALARSVPDAGGVYFVPAFAGLGAPYWDVYARGTIVGLTAGTTRAHIVRAILEAMAYQVRDVVEAMEADTGLSVPLLRADGGGSANAFLMQFQSDILGIPLECPEVSDTTALGAAFLAGLGAGFWRGRDELAGLRRVAQRYQPRMPEAQRQALYEGWQRAVERARGWVQAP